MHPVVELRLLGAADAVADVLADGVAVELGHARQRTVLAALAVEVNRVVPSGTLIERVWADRPPHRARNALSAYVSRLRRRLAGVAGLEVSRGPGGYALAADPRHVDLHRFRGLAVRARAATEPAQAAVLFTEALGLWRGVPFAGVDTPWFADVRTSLLAERFAVALDGNDAGLAAGRHAELLVGLLDAVRAHPLDERLAGQLMLALARCGRQADALTAYAHLRERLRDELGADPGAGVREVHRQVLAGEPGGPAPAPAVPSPAPPPVPALPRRPTSFVGRADDVGATVADLRGARLVTLVGVGGVGKSRLALEAAARLEAAFGDGARLCELAAVADGGAVGHAVAAALQVRQRHGLSIDDSVVAYLRGRELLLVVDNCEHVLDAAARLVDAVVTHCPAVTVLATSRAALGVEGERLRPVPPLPADDAERLFADRAAAQRPGFAGDGAVAELCRRLDGLPLAIELAAARMRVMNAAEVVRRLDAGRFVGVAARTAPPRHQSLGAAVDWSYRLLEEPERRLFARLSVFAGGFDAEAAHGVCSGPGAELDDTLDLLIGLVDKSMVTVLGTAGRTRYRVLETLRAYGRERLGESGEELPVARRHAAWFTRFAGEVGAGLHGRDERRWVERALPEHDNLRTAVGRALGDGDGDTAIRLVTSVSELVHLRVGYESAAWAVRALHLAGPAHPLFPAAVGAAARGAWNRSDFAAARTLAARADGRRPARGTDRVAYPADVLADVALYEGDAAAALRHYDAEVAQARADDDPVRLVWTLYYVAVCHAVLRRPERGLGAAAESVEVADATGNPTARAMARYALGLVLKKSEPGRALALLDESAELAGSVHNRWWHGIALMEAAATRTLHGDARAAARTFLRVLDHWDRAGDHTQQWLNLRYVTRLLVRLGADADALALHGALVAAGKPSPLGPAPAPAAGPALPEAVRRAREALHRHS